MRHSLFPDDYVASTYRIDFAALARQGYRGIIFDVDNTLVPHGAPADERAKKLFEELHTLGYRCILLSNNKERRVAEFAGEVGSRYIFKAGKPSVKGYERAMEEMGTDRKTTLFVGDQLFTDIWGANRAGIYSVLTKPINPREEIQIVLKRIPERLVLRFYERDRRRKG